MDPREPGYKRIKLLSIVGPTAVGKTGLSLRLGPLFDSEIISADSRQIYRHMDIGTAKATEAERAVLPHHLIDIVDPDEELSLAQYKARAQTCIQDIWGRHKLPILVGGTGLYMRALWEGWTIPEVPPNEVLREILYLEAEKNGHAALHARLAEVDRQAAQSIDARNVRRVVRALEVYEITGQPISELQRKQPPDWDMFTIGLTMDRALLYERIDQRVDLMMEQGLEAEVRDLVDRGYTYDLPSMSGLGYKQIGLYLQGQVTLEEAVALIKRHTRRFVRQQYNWFRLTDPNIQWIDATEMDRADLSLKLRTFVKRS